MVLERHQHGVRSDGGYSPQAEHPDPASPPGLIAQTRAVYYGSIPSWPAPMIGPSESELTRWAELWKHPRSARWIETKQEHTVASLVRVEQRCDRRVPSASAQVELRRLRDQLGLVAGQLRSAEPESAAVAGPSSA